MNDNEIFDRMQNACDYLLYCLGMDLDIVPNKVRLTVFIPNADGTFISKEHEVTINVDAYHEALERVRKMQLLDEARRIVKGDK